MRYTTWDGMLAVLAMMTPPDLGAGMRVLTGHVDRVHTQADCPLPGF